MEIDSLPVTVDADDGQIACLNSPDSLAIAFDKTALHELDRIDRSAQVLDLPKLVESGGLDCRDLAFNGRIAVEQIVELEEIRFVGKYLLHAK